MTAPTRCLSSDTLFPMDDISEKPAAVPSKATPANTESTIQSCADLVLPSEIVYQKRTPLKPQVDSIPEQLIFEIEISDTE